MVTDEELRRRLPHTITVGNETIKPIRELKFKTHDAGVKHFISKIGTTVSWYSTLTARAERKYRLAELQADEMRLDLIREYKHDHPKCKEADAKLYADSDEELRKLKRRVIRLAANYKEMLLVREAAVIQSRLVQSFGANVRAERHSLLVQESP